VTAAADAGARQLLGQLRHHLRDVEPDAVGPEDGEVRAEADRDDGIARLLHLPVVYLAGRLPRRGVDEPVCELVDVDAVEVRVVRQQLVVDMRERVVHLSLHVAVGAVGEERDELAVAVGVATEVQYILDDGVTGVVPEPVGGVIERLADVVEIGLLVAGLAREVEIPIHRVGLRAIGEPRHRRHVFEIVGERRVDHPRELDAHHPRRDAVVLVVEIRVHVGVEQRLDGLRVGMVVVHDDDRDLVLRERAVGRRVLRRRAVVEHQQQRELLAVSLLIFERVVQVPRHVLHLVVGGLRREPAEQMLRGLPVLVDLADEPLERELDGNRRAHPVAVGVMAHSDGPAVEDRTPKLSCHVAQLLVNRLERLPLDERLRLGRRGGLRAPGFEPLAHFGTLLAAEPFEGVHLDLDRPLARLHVTGHADGIAGLDLGVCTDAGLLERRRRDDAGAVAELEQRRPAGLFDPDDLALDVDRLPDRVGEGGDVDVLAVANLGGDGVGRVGFVKGEIAVLADLRELDGQLVADGVVAVEDGVVDESGDVLGDIDEDAVLDDAVDGRVIQRPLLDVGERTAVGERVDGGAGGPRAGSFSSVNRWNHTRNPAVPPLSVSLPVSRNA